MSDPAASSFATDAAVARRSMTTEPRRNVAPFFVALAGWLLPGAGYWLIGHRTRGTVAGFTILLLFAAGIFIGGIRVVDVPGYGEEGRKVMVMPPRYDPNNPPPPRWALVAQPLPTVLQKPWYLGQILAGPVTLLASYGSLEAAAREYPKSTAHVAEFGTLYCAVAGMLNLLIILDSTARSVRSGE